MITETLFKKCFSKIEASFSRGISEKIKEGWYEEVMQSEPYPFTIAMNRLKMGDKFPHFHDFWVYYNLASGKITDEAERGCPDCRKGYLHFIQEGYDVTALCGVCWPDNKMAQDLKSDREYQVGMEPWKTKKTVIIPREIFHAMLSELLDKMKRGGVDWKAETEEAWALHEKAVQRESYHDGG